MNKFKVGQRIISPKFGEGVVKKIDSDGDLCIEFDKKNNALHSCIGACAFPREAYYDNDGNFLYNESDDAITPIGPYEGERIINSEYGKGTIVETDSGISKDSILVQYDVRDYCLHDGNQYTNNGRYANNTCWYYSKSNYGTAIKAHVEKYHSEPAAPTEPLIPEGFMLVDAQKPPAMYDVELLLKDGSRRYGCLRVFTGDGYVVYDKGAKPKGTGKNCVYVTENHADFIPASEVLAWRHITAPDPLIPEGWNTGNPDSDRNVHIKFFDGETSVGFLSSYSEIWYEFPNYEHAKATENVEFGIGNAFVCKRNVVAWKDVEAKPVVPEGWNAGHPDNNDNVEIMLDNGDTSVAYWSNLYGKWYEFDKKEHAKALEDKHFDSVHAHECKRDVIAWRVPQPKPEQKQFKRGDRVVTPQGYHGTFVAYTDSKKAIFMLDEGQGKGWRADFEPGRYGEFLYVDPEELKPES